jgi:hypothetical protein
VVLASKLLIPTQTYFHTGGVNGQKAFVKFALKFFVTDVGLFWLF